MGQKQDVFTKFLTDSFKRSLRLSSDLIKVHVIKPISTIPFLRLDKYEQASIKKLDYEFAKDFVDKYFLERK